MSWTTELPKENGRYWFVSKFGDDWFPPELCTWFAGAKQIKINEDYFELSDVDQPMFWSIRTEIPPAPSI